jgi:pyruvate dehydrogenase E1 component
MASNAQRCRLISDGLPNQLPDLDPGETQEWVQSLDAVVEHARRTRAPIRALTRRPVARR